MVAFGWKGGIGSASRARPRGRGDRRRARARELRLGAATCGSTACRCSRRSATASTRVRRPGAASRSSPPTRRSQPRSSSALARRAGLGLARTGLGRPPRERRDLRRVLDGGASATSIRRRGRASTVPDAPRPALRRRRRGDRGGRAQRALGGGRHTGREGRVVRALPHEPVLRAAARQHGRVRR